MKAGTRFSARVLIFSAISGFMLTNSYLLSAEDSSAQASLDKKQSIKTVRNPQNTLLNAIQRELNSARRISKPRTLFPKKEKQSSQIQQVGLTFNPKSLFQKRSQSSKNYKKPEIVRGGKRSTPSQYQTAVPSPIAKPGQSEIQRQLEALYRRDGRKMPPMQLNALPQTANSQPEMGRGTLNSAQTPQANSSSQNIAGSPNRNRYQQPTQKTKWYNKFLPTKTKQSPKRLQQSNQIVRKAPVAPPVSDQPESSTLPELSPAPSPNVESVVTKSNQTETIANSLEETEEKVESEELQITADKTNSTENSVPEVKSAEAAPQDIASQDDFQNLFPDMSEAEADNLKKPLVKEQVKSPQTPFSGLVLEGESLKKADKKQAETSKPLQEDTPQVAQESTKKDVNPFEPQSDAPVAQSTADPKKTTESFEVPDSKVVENDDNSTDRKLKQILDNQSIEPIKQVDTRDRNRSIEKKLQIIASRGNIKGLKGFCSVALRENRILVDARPEFSSSYKSMNYQFASLENKLKFDREPAKYAPAAGGSDIVLLVDQQDDKEGTLDFASWYKGKLYLFSNKTNMDLFMKTPALYVGVE